VSVALFSARAVHHLLIVAVAAPLIALDVPPGGLPLSWSEFAARDRRLQFGLHEVARAVPSFSGHFANNPRCI